MTVAEHVPGTVAGAHRDPAFAASPLRAILFDADGKDSEPDLSQIDHGALSEKQLLWIDMCGDDETALSDLLARLGLTGYAAAVRAGLEGRPRVENFGDWFLVRAAAVANDDHSQSDGDSGAGNKRRDHIRAGQLRVTAQDFTIVTGPNYVLTLHYEPLHFLDALREREQADTQLGVLSAESFTASLLDWQLATYFDAVSNFEAAVDRLEVTLLTRHRQRDCLPQLAELRRVVSKLRRQLAPHRNLFAALERPDFRPSAENASADAHFHQIGKRFDHAMEAVENARDMVVGSFELFATRAAQRTNENMRRLTFATVLLGTLAVLAGILGMNFDVAFFDSGGKGFWSAIAGMITIALVALGVARTRDWL